MEYLVLFEESEERALKDASDRFFINPSEIEIVKGSADEGLDGAYLARVKDDSPHAAGLRVMAVSLVQFFAPESRVTVSESDDELLLEIDGPRSDRLAAEDGEGLNALQFLLSRVLVKQIGPFDKRLNVDAAQYRTKREAELRELADRMAQRAKDEGRKVQLQPLPPRDRRTVHLQIEKIPGVRSESIGKNHLKRVAIIPD